MSDTMDCHVQGGWSGSTGVIWGHPTAILEFAPMAPLLLHRPIPPSFPPGPKSWWVHRLAKSSRDATGAKKAVKANIWTL